MTFRLELSPAARHDLAGLDRSVQRQVARKLDEIAADPRRFFLGLKGRMGWKLRVGDYRILADVMESKGIVLVTAIRHRRNLYG